MKKSSKLQKLATLIDTELEKVDDTLPLVSNVSKMKDEKTMVEKKMRGKQKKREQYEGAIDSTRAKIVGFCGLGGAGTRIAISTVGSSDSSGFGRRLTVDIDRDYPSYVNDAIDFHLLKGSGVVTATAGVFTLSEKMLTETLRNPTASFDEDTVNALETYLVGPAGKQYNLVGLVAATGGGTGHGFMRAVMNQYGKKIKSRLAPIGILPDGCSPPAEYLNSLAFFGMMDRVHREIGLPTVISVENNALRELSGSSDLRLMNQVLGGCIRLMAHTLSKSLAQGLSWGNIDRGFVDFYSPEGLSVSTFGISRNVKMRGIGENSIKKAFLKAHANNLLGLDPKKSEHIGTKLNGIVFVNAPQSLDPGKAKQVIQKTASDVWRHADYEIKEVFVSTDSHVTTLDVVVLFGGQITPPVLRETISKDDLILSHIENRLDVFKKQVDGNNKENSDYFTQAKEDFYGGYDLLNQMMKRR